MNVYKTAKLKLKILLEFKKGMSLARCDDLWQFSAGTTEREVREALKRQDEAEQKELALQLPQIGEEKDVP